jgi:lipopolysaccharide export LptBFGC system permease protein LptF
MLMRYLFCVIFLFAFGCGSKGEQQKAAIHRDAKETNAQSVQVTEGIFERTNVDGDFWFLFVKNDQGTEEQIVFTGDSVLSRQNSYVGKKVKVTWRKEMFEQAGNNEKFEGKLLLNIIVTN